MGRALLNQVWILGLLMLSGCGTRHAAPSPYLRPIAEEPPTATPAVPRTPTPPASSKRPLVFLDPGHGGSAIGAQNTSRRLQEKRITLDIAKRVERLLTARGYPVRLSRTRDVAVSYQKRVQNAERWSAAVFVSIHINSAPSPDITGAEVFYSSKVRNTPERVVASKRLGTSILNSLCRTLPTKSRGLKEGDFYVIRETTMPAVLVESAFITNPKESLLLTSASYKQQIALAIAKGIDGYFGKRA
jgi:N-acetylmuramoyl-L-alanine amidase